MPPDPQMRWLRLWTDVLEDPKLLLLAAEDRWYYVALLACKRSGLMDEVDSPELRDRKIAIRLRIDHRERDELKRRLQEVRLIDEHWQPLGWEKRQFSSDLDRTAAERQRRHRETLRHGDVTRDKSVTNGVTHGRVTTPEQSRADTEQSKRARKRASRVPPEFSPDTEFARREIPDLDVDREVQKFRDHEFKTPRSDWAAVWRTWIGTCRESGRYARVQPSQISLEERIRENSGWR